MKCVQWSLSKEDTKPLLVQATQRNGAINNLCIINIKYVYFQLFNCSLSHLTLLAWSTSFERTHYTSAASSLSRNSLPFYVWIFVNICTRPGIEIRTDRKFHVCWMCERWGYTFLYFLKCSSFTISVPPTRQVWNLLTFPISSLPNCRLKTSFILLWLQWKHRTTLNLVNCGTRRQIELSLPHPFLSVYKFYLLF